MYGEGEKSEKVGILLKRSRGNTATSLPGLQDNARSSFGALVLDEGPITGHAVLGAIEHGRRKGVGGVFVPSVVGLCALVAALVAQGLLVGPGEVAVPGEEGALDFKNQFH